MGAVDLWSLITVVAEQNRQLNDVFSVVDQLPTDQKAELVQRLLKSSDLNVTFGNNQLSGTIIVQINTMDQTALAEILNAIANRITTEPPGDGLVDNPTSPKEGNGNS